MLCFYQPLVYPVITKRLGIVGTYTAGAITFTFATSLFSFMTYLTPYGPTAVWTAMVIFRALYVHSATCMFAGSGILINNSCEIHYVSKANAIGQAIASFARAGQHLLCIFGSEFSNRKCSIPPDFCVLNLKLLG